MRLERHNVLLTIFVCLTLYAEPIRGIGRVLSEILGYDRTCGTACSLSISCWLVGGRSNPGCGPAFLLTCCKYAERQDPLEHFFEPQEFQSFPSKKVEDNVLRRRIDDDASQDECGIPGSKLPQKRIIGGREARTAEYPWQAHVRISQYQCGGVLVSRVFVATAAHCVQKARPRDIAVWLGATDTTTNPHNSNFLFSDFSLTPPPNKHGVSQKILHPLFQFRITQPDRYDIALLRLSRAVRYTPFVLPICLPHADLQLEGKHGIIAGWGKTDPGRGHSGTNRLRSATVPILSREQCIQWHSSKSIAVEIHSEMLCAGHPDGRQDACLGDSGGPLIVFDDISSRFTLAGITSAGFGCGVDHQPGIYHNVQITQMWIRKVIQNW